MDMGANDSSGSGYGARPQPHNGGYYDISDQQTYLPDSYNPGAGPFSYQDIGFDLDLGGDHNPLWQGFDGGSLGQGPGTIYY